MDYLWCFIVGGLICAIGQILMDATKLTTPRILVSFVISGAILEGIGVYEKLVALAGFGAKIPLPGFGYALAKGAIEGSKDGIFGVLEGAISSVSIGVCTAIVFGYVIAMICSPKSPA